MRSHLRQGSDPFTSAGDGRVPPQAALQESILAAVTVRQYQAGSPQGLRVSPGCPALRAGSIHAGVGTAFLQCGNAVLALTTLHPTCCCSSSY